MLMVFKTLTKFYCEIAHLICDVSLDSFLGEDINLHATVTCFLKLLLNTFEGYRPCLQTNGRDLFLNKMENESNYFRHASVF